MHIGTDAYTCFQKGGSRPALNTDPDCVPLVSGSGRGFRARLRQGPGEVRKGSPLWPPWARDKIGTLRNRCLKLLLEGRVLVMRVVRVECWRTSVFNRVTHHVLQDLDFACAFWVSVKVKVSKNCWFDDSAWPRG